MTRKLSTVFLSLVLTLMTLSAAHAKEKDKFYSWQGYDFSYPSGWKIVADKDIPEGGRVVVISQAKEGLEVILGLFDKMTGEDAKKEKVTPARLAMAFGIPIALQQAAKNESAISISYGSIGLSDTRNLSTRITVALPDSPDVYNFECFSTTTGNKLFAGVIKSSSKKGHVPEDNTSYRTTFQEAYHIVKSINSKKQSGSKKDLD